MTDINSSEAARKDLALSLLGKRVRFTHLPPGLGDTRVQSVGAVGMVTLEGHVGEFDPALLVVVGEEEAPKQEFGQYVDSMLSAVSDAVAGKMPGPATAALVMVLVRVARHGGATIDQLLEYVARAWVGEEQTLTDGSAKKEMGTELL